MNGNLVESSARPSGPSAADPDAPYAPPAYEVIPLGCEITAYAPDDDPLF